jgi:hypothetical protein
VIDELLRGYRQKKKDEYKPILTKIENLGTLDRDEVYRLLVAENMKVDAARQISGLLEMTKVYMG